MKLVVKAICYCLFMVMAYHSQAQCVSGKRIQTFSGDTLLYICPDGKPDILSFRPYTFSTPFLFAITNKNDTIVRLSTSGLLDFNGLPGAEFHVYGFSYKGSINKVIGLPILSARITDLCYARSTNYITVIQEYPIAPIINNIDLLPGFICAPDSKPDSIYVEASFPTRTKIKYLVVNEENKIVWSTDLPVFDGDQLNCNVCKTYAMSFIGNYTGSIGSNISSALASDCYVLSANFITTIRDLPRGGKIQFFEGQDDLFICSSSTKSQVLSTQLVNNSAGYTRTVFTDTLNRVLAVAESASIPVEALSAGTCRIWGLTFTGKLTEGFLGQNINTMTWSDDCFAITENALTVVKALPDGGQPRFLNLPDSQYICKDLSADFIHLASPNSKGQDRLWVITDNNGTVQTWSDSVAYDFNNLPIGPWRIYHLGYTGILTLTIGQSIAAPASDDCFDYSDQFLTILIDIPKTGTLQFADQTTEKFYCATDTGELSVEISWSGTGFLPATLFLTDTQDRFITLFSGKSLDISALNNGVYRVYGISYTGQLNLTSGSVINRSNLSSGCAQLSESLTVIKDEAIAGSISLEDGKDTLRLCTSQAVVSIRFKSLLQHNSFFTYILTTDKDTVIRVLERDTLHLNTPLKGICKIWGLAYTGEILIQPGDHIKNGVLATGCANVSSNPVILIKDEPIGGRISLASGDTTYTICHKDGWPDFIPLKTTSQTFLEYQYVLADGDDKILAFHAEQINFETLPPGTKKIFGVSYLGSVLVKIGDTLTRLPFAADCFQWSENSIQVFADELSAGTIKTNRNVTLLNYCINESGLDTVYLSKNGATPGVNYIYVGIQSDTLKYISTSGLIINQQIPSGTLQVFGMAYRGNFTTAIGSKVSESRLADSCFNISANSITIHKYAPNAGTVSSGGGIKDYFLCPQDGQSDFISVVSSGEVPLPYAYIITSAAGDILGWSFDASFDLDTFSLGFCKIYGISYTGSLQLLGKTILSDGLSTGCFAISTDFISVYKANADAGRISLTNGDTTATICVEDLGKDTLLFTHTGNTGLKYAFLITDQNNRLQSIIEQSSAGFDFNGADPGVSRIYGVSYGGLLSVFRNDNVTSTILASGCYDLSSNFITLQKVNSGPSCKTSGVDGSSPAFLSIFPNPAKQEVFLQFRNKSLQGGKPAISLISLAGGFQQKINLPIGGIDNEQVRVDISALSPGIYFIIFKNGYIFDRVKLVVAK